MTGPITVAVVDDNRLLRDGIASLLGAQPDIRIVGAVGTAEEGAALVMRMAPRIVLVDARLGEHDSRLFIERLREAGSDARIVVMDFLATHEEVLEFVGAGASGFVLKEASVPELLTTIRAVAAGETVIPPYLDGALLSRIATAAGRAAHSLSGLSEPERQVVMLIAHGLGNREIARRLEIPIGAVRGHADNVLEKLAVHARSRDPS